MACLGHRGSYDAKCGEYKPTIVELQTFVGKLLGRIDFTASKSASTKIDSTQNACYFRKKRRVADKFGQSVENKFCCQQKKKIS